MIKNFATLLGNNTFAYTTVARYPRHEELVLLPQTSNRCREGTKTVLPMLPRTGLELVRTLATMQDHSNPIRG